MNKSDANFKNFIIGTVLIGIVIFIIVFVSVFSLFKGNKTEIKEAEIKIDELTQKEMMGVILDINLSSDKITVYDFKNEKVIEDMRLISQTKYINSSAVLLAPSELEIGDTVNLIYTDKSLAISQVKVTADGWKKENVVSYKMDYIDNKITIDKKIYKFTSDIAITYQGKKVKSEDLGENVILTVKGYENTVWAIEIKEYLGNIRLTYPDLLEGADVEIDSEKFVKIKEVEDIYLTVGKHKLVIKKADIDPIIINVEVEENEVTEVDLGEIDTKKSIVTFNINVDDFYVDIRKDDGTVNATYTNCLTDSSMVMPLYYNQTELPYGNYVMTFRKKGCNTITRNITISTANKKLNVTLTSDGTTVKTTITAVPDSAEIYINGKYQGTGTVKTLLYKGSNTVEVSKTGYTSIKKVINVETAKEYTFNLIASNIYETEEENNVSDDVYKKEN